MRGEWLSVRFQVTVPSCVSGQRALYLCEPVPHGHERGLTAPIPGKGSQFSFWRAICWLSIQLPVFGDFITDDARGLEKPIQTN
jgi:hypothetical protein